MFSWRRNRSPVGAIQMLAGAILRTRVGANAILVGANTLTNLGADSTLGGAIGSVVDAVGTLVGAIALDACRCELDTLVGAIALTRVGASSTHSWRGF